MLYDSHYIRAEPQLLEKNSCKIGWKAENIFLEASIKISENFDIKHMRWSLYLVKYQLATLIYCIS